MKISVIIPVYNCEKSIKKCLNSVINQTYKNIEIICVDDGSIDNSGIICDEFKEKYDNIIVIHKENEGVSSARNIGIKIATGKYIGFVDSDDYIEKNMFQILYDNIISNNYDLSICGHFEEYIGKIINRFNGDIIILDTNKALDYILSRKEYMGVLWNKLFKTDIIKKNNLMLYNDIHICEDLLFCSEYITKCAKIIYEKKPLYHYTKSEDSSYNSSYNSKWLSVIDAFDKIEKIYTNEQYKINLIKVKKNKLILLCDLRIKMLLKKMKKTEEMAKVNNAIKKDLFLVIKDKNIIYKDKLNIIIKYIFPKYFYYLNKYIKYK